MKEKDFGTFQNTIFSSFFHVFDGNSSKIDLPDQKPANVHVQSGTAVLIA